MSKLPRDTLPRTSRLGADSFFEGKLSFSHALEVLGRVKGEMESDTGFLILDTSARLDARVVVHTLQAKGQICGDIVCHQRCALQDGALVKGIVIAPTVEVVAGVSFDGEINMFSPSDSLKLMGMTPQQAHKHIMGQALNIDDPDVRKRYGINAPPSSTEHKGKQHSPWLKKRDGQSKPKRVRRKGKKES